jgi:hypothetical protein
MKSQKNDPVLVVVGLILVLAIIGWAIAVSVIPTQPQQSKQKIAKYSSTGKALGESLCCKTPGVFLTGSSDAVANCQNQKEGCSKYGLGNCPYQKKGCQKSSVTNPVLTGKNS